MRAIGLWLAVPALAPLFIACGDANAPAQGAGGSSGCAADQPACVPAGSSGGSIGVDGSSTGGAVSTGGMVSSGGASSGGASSGGVSSGGAPSGGAASGSAASGGVG